jgi:serine/threonine protein kinase/dienelactone hydrolase
MECPRCHAENRDDSRFCSQCATPFDVEESLPATLTQTVKTPVPVIPKDALIAGKYKIIEEIGRGGMGVVYKAEDIKLQRTVALKFLPANLAESAELKGRFLIEARAAAALSHPNICVIHEVGESEERPYIAMEYVEGETLRDRIRKESLTTENILAITSQVAAGLGEAHHKGIVHRDIKSANIMVTAKGQAKVMDFGLAKRRGGSSLTKSHATLGTVAYMSPEQARGDEEDQRTDLWALGVVLYEMLTGKLPFGGDRDLSIIHSIIHDDPKPISIRKPPVPQELQQVVARALRKKCEARYGSAEEVLKDLKAYEETLRAEASGVFNLRYFVKRLRRPAVAVPTVLVMAGIVALTVWLFNRQAKIRWARHEILPEIERRLADSWRDSTDIYKLAEEAEKVIPNDPKLIEVFSKCALNIRITTDPPGADIYVKEYDSPDSEWEYLGVSPLENVRTPIGVFRYKIEKEGYETVLAASSSWAPAPPEGFGPNELFRKLDKKGTIPKGMVRVTGAKTPLGELPDFFIDRHEVTNRQYKEFIDKGGYRSQEYWKHEFIKDGQELTWDEAMREFVDPSDQPGPSSWQAGDYPEGQEDFPISGISWYEAAAYAEFSGKSLPTATHWGIAMGEYTPMIRWFQLGGYAIFAPFSNIEGRGPVPVGSLQGMTSYGVLDMAGNVREWCWSETQKGRLIRGGGWIDNSYMFQNVSQASPFDRSPHNGLRCVLYPDPERIPKSVFDLVPLPETVDFSRLRPVPDSIFEVYERQFYYDQMDLDARLEWKDESHDDWLQELVSFSGAYGGERMLAVLFLPRNAAPPYQTVVYFPGVQAQWRKSSRDIESSGEFEIFLSFVVKSGRAAVYPAYKGTMERNFERPAQWQDSYRQMEYRLQLVKDFKRCVDYLESRPDIDSDRLAYYGMSWGAAWPGVIIPAVEKRLKASVLLAGGLSGGGRAEVDPINYVTRVTIPTLLLNGRYDRSRPYEAMVKPLYDLLGAPAEDKRLILYDTDHIPPRNEFVKEILAWQDRYLGPVRR